MEWGAAGLGAGLGEAGGSGPVPLCGLFLSWDLRFWTPSPGSKEEGC